MPQWGSGDEANDSPIFAPANVKTAPTRAAANTLYQNTTANAYVDGQTVGVYSISAGEMNHHGFYYLTGASLVQPGTAGTIQAGDIIELSNSINDPIDVATFVVTESEIRTVTVANGGSGYTNGDLVTLSGISYDVQPVFEVTTGSSDDEIASLSIEERGVFTGIVNNSGIELEALTGSGEGGEVNYTLRVHSLSLDNPGKYPGPFETSANLATDTSTVTVDITSAAGAPEARSAAQTGWALRREGTGGRAGRVTYETLVALHPDEDGSGDDAVLPQAE